LECDYLIPDSDIKSIYNNVDSFSLNATLRKSCIGTNSKKVSVDVNISGHALVSIDRPIKREFHKEKTLYEKEGRVGKVVEHMHFFIEEQYRRKGIAKSIHQSELVFYKNNGFKQIQLTAIFEGVIVWSKLFYKFKDSVQEEEIMMQLFPYLKQVHKLSIKDIEKKLKNKDLKELILNIY